MDPKSAVIFTSLLAGAAFVSYKSLEFSQTVQFSSEGWSKDIDSHVQYSPSSAAESKIDIDEFLIGVIENFRVDMLTGLPELKVPVLDPFKNKKPIKVNVQDKNAVVQGNFTDLLVEGLSGFGLESLHADLQNLSLEFVLRIPRIRAVGNYTLDGKIIKIIPLRGKGEFWVESHNLSVAARASMVTTDGDEHLQLAKDFDVEMDFDKVELDLENFLGGGRWTEVLLKIVNDISKDLFRMCLPLLKEELNKSLLKVINKHLMKLPITSIIPGSSANEYVDQILANVQAYVRDHNLDPMELPDYASNFSKEIAYITFNGEARLYDGWLSGVSTLHRTDECDLKTNRTTISVSAHLGLRDLALTYKGKAKFMSMGPSLICGGNIKKVSFYFHIEQSNKKGAKPSLKEFEIVELSTIWIELSGLGPLTWILKWMMTGISKLVEGFIVDKVTQEVYGYMATEFEKLSFPV